MEKRVVAPDEGEGVDAQVDAAGGQPLSDHPRQEEVLHCRVEHLLHHPVQAVHLVDEEHLLGL